MLARHGSWSGSMLSLSIAVSCLHTTFSIMQRADKATRETTHTSQSCRKRPEVGSMRSLLPGDNSGLLSFPTEILGTGSQCLLCPRLCREKQRNGMSEIQCQTASAAGRHYQMHGFGEVNTHCRAALCRSRSVTSQCHPWQN